MRFDDADLLAKTIAEIVDTREWDGEPVDGLDGVAFEPGELYLTLARWLPMPGDGDRPPDAERLHRAADLLPLAAASARPTC